MTRNQPLTDAEKTRQLFRLRSAIADSQRDKDGQESEAPATDDQCRHCGGPLDADGFCFCSLHESDGEITTPLEAPDLITVRPVWPKEWDE